MNWQPLAEAPRARRVLALGNFDGVHLGHAAVLRKAVVLADQLGAVPSALVLHPHPAQVLRPQDFPGLLTPLPDRAALLGRLGVKEGYVLPFDRTRAAMAPEHFVTEVLVAALGAVAVVVGENYHYGHNGQGDTETLRREGRRYGFQVHVAPPVTVDDAVVSASRIRSALAAGNTELARLLLGRPYAVRGSVRHGAGRGRTLGFPTLNLRVAEEYVRPRAGVYAVFVAGLGPGVANFGPRPTVAEEEPLLEVHLFAPPPDRVGEELKVAFGPYLRPQRRFPDLAALAEQIARDKEEARRLAFVASEEQL